MRRGKSHGYAAGKGYAQYDLWQVGVAFHKWVDCTDGRAEKCDAHRIDVSAKYQYECAEGDGSQEHECFLDDQIPGYQRSAPCSFNLSIKIPVRYVIDDATSGSGKNGAQSKYQEKVPTGKTFCSHP